MTNEITWDKIKEIQLKLNKEQSIAFRQKLKNCTVLALNVI